MFSCSTEYILFESVSGCLDHFLQGMFVFICLICALRQNTFKILCSIALGKAVNVVTTCITSICVSDMDIAVPSLWLVDLLYGIGQNETFDI